MEIVQATNGSHFIKSFRNLHDSWSKLWNCMVKIYNPICSIYLIVLHEDSVEYIAQIKGRYIKVIKWNLFYQILLHLWASKK